MRTRCRRRAGCSLKPALPTNFGPMAAEPADVSEDAVLGGRLVLRQPLRGHRFGHDAILLAAAVRASPGEHAVDPAAGVGAAALQLRTACRACPLRLPRSILIWRRLL